MNKNFINLVYNFCFILTFIGIFSSCKDDINNESGASEGDIETIFDDKVEVMNTEIAVAAGLADGKLEITTLWTDDKGNTSIQFSDKSVVIVYKKENIKKKKTIPVLGIDENKNWIYEFYEEVFPLKDETGKLVSVSSVTPKLRLTKEKYWEYSLDGKLWYRLGEKPAGNIDDADRSSFSVFADCKVSNDFKEATLSLRTGGETYPVVVRESEYTEAWNKFNIGADDNVLLDFSYAGYKHGEEAPADGKAWGFKEENIKDYMTPGSNYARDALNKILKKYKLNEATGNPNARLLIYFPEGEYILHDDRDNSNNPDKTNGDKDKNGNNTSHSINIFGGNVIIKGAGRGKTKLIMDTPNLPNSDAMYSSPVLISIKNNSWLEEGGAKVIADAAKGTHSIKVAKPHSFRIGQWVCLYIHDNNRELIDKEMLPYKWEDTMGNISTEGVQVEDYHQIKSVNGDVITFVEPIMHEVEAKYKWELREYKYYENVGIEDLTFVGHAVDDFEHHRSWIDDGAYKPLNFMRLVNSWVRRVDFESVSEAASIISSANVSVYDINILGNRGHSAIRSQGSSRVFIGAVTDRTNGPLADAPHSYKEGAGQYHACGVSKPSMGAVIWNVHWGDDSCFESHATQPRATLIDMCTGGFVQSRQGGDADQVPNHLNDLTIWNMCSTNTKLNGNGNLPPNGEFDWWRDGWKYWKILPPVIVGFHGEPVKFVKEQVKLDENNGVPVLPESLYEAQLARRLGGNVPAWLRELK